MLLLPLIFFCVLEFLSNLEEALQPVLKTALSSVLLLCIR